MKEYLKDISFGKAGYEQSVLDKNCNDVSIILNEMTEKGIPHEKIGKDRVEIYHKKAKEYKAATTGENAENMDNDQNNDALEEAEKSPKHKHKSEEEAKDQEEEDKMEADKAEQDKKQNKEKEENGK